MSHLGSNIDSVSVEFLPGYVVIDNDCSREINMMVTASMMRPTHDSEGCAVIVGNDDVWPSTLEDLHPGGVYALSVNSKDSSKIIQPSLKDVAPENIATVYVSSTNPVLQSYAFVQHLHSLIKSGGMLVFNMGVCDITTPAYANSRSTLQYLGERFGRVYVLTDTPNSCLIVACLKDSTTEKEFHNPEDFVESYERVYGLKLPYVKISCQLFHPLGTISSTPVGRTVLDARYQITDYPDVYKGDFVDTLQGTPHDSMSYHTDHMQLLWDKDKRLGNHLKSFSRVVSYQGDVVGVLPFYGDDFSLIKDSDLVYMYCLLGEDILINFEPTVQPEHFLGVCSTLPPYMSMDISVHFSDKVYRSVRKTSIQPLSVIKLYAGACLFDYETTLIRDLPSLYARMPRDTRKEAQRTLRNIEKNFDVSYGSSVPESDPYWDGLLQNYLNHRRYMDSQLPEKERRECSVAGTMLHLDACKSAESYGMLHTIEIRSKETGQLVAVNFAILHSESQVVADVVCIRNCDTEWRRYSIGVAAILLNYDMFSRVPNARWYDLGTIGVENTYTYKKMFYTDICLRFGVAMSSEMMVLESAIPESKYVFPILYTQPNGSCVTVNNAEESLMIAKEFDLETLQTLQRHFWIYPTDRPLRNEVIALNKTLIEEKLGE